MRSSTREDKPFVRFAAEYPVAVTCVAALVTLALAGLLTPWTAQVLFALGVEQLEVDALAVRVLEILAIIVTLYLLSVWRANTRKAWGIPERSGLAPRLALGFALGVLSLGVGCVLLFVLQVRVTRIDLSSDAGYWLSVVWRAALSAVAVGVLEELWFRGGLFALLQRAAGLPFALFGGAVIYAAAHFLNVPDAISITQSALHMQAGYEALAAALSNVFLWQNFDSFVALFIAGLSLTLVRMRHGDVAMCIGIHAGWVFTIKLFKKYTYILPRGPNRSFAGTYDDVIGWLVAACLLVLLLCLWKFVRVREHG